MTFKSFGESDHFKGMTNPPKGVLLFGWKISECDVEEGWRQSNNYEPKRPWTSPLSQTSTRYCSFELCEKQWTLGSVVEDINGYQPDEEPPLSSVLPPFGGSTKDTGERGGKGRQWRRGKATTYENLMHYGKLNHELEENLTPTSWMDWTDARDFKVWWEGA